MIDSKENFLTDVGSPMMNFLQKIIFGSIKVLALLMAFVIVWSTVDVALLILQELQDPFHSANEVDALLKIFGAFLVVLIAIEIFLNITLYLKKNMNHLKLVIETALMAIARKIIILDYDQVRDWQMIGIGAIILALGFAYWFTSRTHFETIQLTPKKEDPTHQS